MKSKPLPLYFTYSFVSSALYAMIFTVNLLYYILVAKLDPLQLVLVGTALEAAVFVFEVPTGVVADAYSRRTSVILGVFLIGTAFVFNGLWASFWPIMAAQVLWGLGHTFTSGATQAWISDEIGDENAGLAFIRAARWDHWGNIAGITASVFLASVSLRAPIIAGGALFLLLGFYLVLRMPEDGFQPTKIDRWQRWQHLKGTWKGGWSMLRVRPALFGILAVGFLFGFYSEGYDRLWQAHLLERFSLPHLAWLSEWAFSGEMITVIGFAILKVVMSLFTIFTTRLVEPRLHHPRMKALVRLLWACSVFLVVLLALFALAGNLWLALTTVVLIGVIREVTYPVYNTWVNHRLEPKYRATVMSISSQVDAIGQIGGGPIVGVVARNKGIPTGLLASSLMLFPILLVLWLERNSKEDSRGVLEG